MQLCWRFALEIMSTARQDLTDRRCRRFFRQVLEADPARGTEVDETALVSFEHDRCPDPAPGSHRRGVRVAFYTALSTALPNTTPYMAGT